MAQGFEENTREGKTIPFYKDHPRYALNNAMKNKVLPEPVETKIGRPKKIS